MSLETKLQALALRLAAVINQRGLPRGGTPGQVLARAGASDFGTGWVDVSAGTSGSVLAPASSLLPLSQQDSVVTNFQAGHGWAFQTGTVGTQADDTSTYAAGTQSLRVITDGAGGVSSTRKTGLTLNLSSKIIKIAVRVDDPTRVADLLLYLSSDSMATSASLRILPSTVPSPTWLQPGEWTVITLSLGDLITPANVNLSSVNALQLRAKDRAAGSFTVNFGGIWSATRSVKGMVSFTFDDGWASQFDVARPALDAYRFPATLYVISDRVGQPGYVTADQLRTLQDVGGWEMGAHAHTLNVHDTRFTNVSLGVLEADILAQKTWFQEQGLRVAENLAYPGGQFNPAVEGLMREHFASARSIYSVQRETMPVARLTRLRSWSVTSSDTLASVKAQVDAAAANGDWLILTFHKLTASPTVSTEWATADFQALVTYVASKGIDVKTVGEALRTPVITSVANAGISAVYLSTGGSTAADFSPSGTFWQNVSGNSNAGNIVGMSFTVGTSQTGINQITLPLVTGTYTTPARLTLVKLTASNVRIQQWQSTNTVSSSNGSAVFTFSPVDFTAGERYMVGFDQPDGVTTAATAWPFYNMGATQVSGKLTIVGYLSINSSTGAAVQALSGYVGGIKVESVSATAVKNVTGPLDAVDMPGFNTASVNQVPYKLNATTVAWVTPVTGPTSSTNRALAMFNGTTGKVIADSGITISATGGLAVSPDGSAYATGAYTSAIGRSVQAIADYSRAAGRFAIARIIGQDVMSTSSATSTGDTVRFSLTLSGTTANATPKELLPQDDAAPAANNRLRLFGNDTLSFIGTANARNNNGTERITWRIEGVAVMSSAGVVAVDHWSAVPMGTATSGAANWSLTLAPDSATYSVRMMATGAASGNTRFSATIWANQTGSSS